MNTVIRRSPRNTSVDDFNSWPISGSSNAIGGESMRCFGMDSITSSVSMLVLAIAPISNQSRHRGKINTKFGSQTTDDG